MKLPLPPKTILLPSPVIIIGTYGPDGKTQYDEMPPGAEIVSSKPPCISVSIREATLSFHNIQQTEAFTIKHSLGKNTLREADFVGMYREENTTNSKVTGLTPEKSKLVNAPIVHEFPIPLNANC